MARSFGGTTSDKIQIANATPINITGTALSVAVWFRKADTGTRRYQFGKSGASASPFAYGMRVDATNQIVFLVDGGAGVYDNAASTTTVTANTWTHAVGVKNGTGAGAISVYVNGTQEGAATSNVTLASNTNDLLLGYRDVSAASEIWSGDLAEFAVWNVALTAAECAALAKGVSPLLIRPQSLQYYAPLWGRASAEHDLRNGNGGTVTGTSASDHPPMLRPTRGQLGVTARPRSGDASITLGALTLTADGSLALSGAASVTLGTLTLAADGGVTGIAADAAITLGTLTAAGAGTLALQADSAPTLGALTVSSAGALALTGSAAITLGALTMAGDAARGVVFTPWAQHTFALTADDFSRTARRDTTFAIGA